MIEMNNVSFRYGKGLRGVNNINLSVQKGECVVLTGESGCGKTTVTRLINGLAPKYYSGTKTGTIFIDGKDIDSIHSYEIGRSVGSIFQDPRRQFFSSELEGEVAFACENYGLPQMEIRKRTEAAIFKMGLNHIGNTSLDLISSGEKQRTAIASVYALYPSVFVFDEPTANLDEDGICRIKKIIEELKGMGYTLLIAEHRIHWLYDVADRFLYMQDGEIKNQYTAKELCTMDNNDRMKKGLRLIKKITPELPTPSSTKKIAVKAEKISYKKGKKQILKDVDIIANERSITAITGYNGIGKTTLALLLSGLERLQNGAVFIDGKKENSKGLRKRVYYCSNDTGTQFFTESVSEELLLEIAHTDENLEVARQLLLHTHLYDYKDAHPAALSGGQRQRLAVCCSILSNKPILILDEPTSGLDGKNMYLLAELLKDTVKAGKTVLVITHDEEFISACCDYRISLKD